MSIIFDSARSPSHRALTTKLTPPLAVIGTSACGAVCRDFIVEGIWGSNGVNSDFACVTLEVLEAEPDVTRNFCSLSISIGPERLLCKTRD